MTDAEISQEILDALIDRAKNLIWATELCIGPKRRRIDFWSISPHQGKAYRATSYEVKASRSDFKRETPEKQRLARLYCDEFYYVAPQGLLKPEDIPDWAGLQEWTGSSFRFTVHAPARDKDAPSWELLTSILRYSGQTRRDTDMMQSRIGQLEAQNKRLQETVGRISNERLKLISQMNKNQPPEKQSI
tara:strand:- start:565 stop:1131 length:567 start_codon:yes stop_codon:yes gene_type:complete